MEQDIQVSAANEDRIYRSNLSTMYDAAFTKALALFDEVFTVTGAFKVFPIEGFLENPNRLKILRYIIKPSLSQMKFAQQFSLPSQRVIEDSSRALPAKYKNRLSGAWNDIITFVIQNYDWRRFPWLLREVQIPTNAEIDAARNWTCGLIADANAQTEYRNWRKDQQENLIASWLVRNGYRENISRSIISRATDLRPGEFRRETKVQGQTLQKADLCIRSKKTGRLVLLEAKAVGVKIDAYKRCKECCDKARDWDCDALERPQVIALIAGHFSATNLGALRKAGISFVWEHKMDVLGVFV